MLRQEKKFAILAAIHIIEEKMWNDGSTKTQVTYCAGLQQENKYLQKYRVQKLNSFFKIFKPEKY